MKHKIEKNIEENSTDIFLNLGGAVSWGVITALCAIAAMASYSFLPEQIPIQWSDGIVTGEAGKMVIFAYPTACVVIRFILYPFVNRWLFEKFHCTEEISSFVTNYLCFVAFTMQAFTILYINGIARSMAAVLVMDVIIFVGVLLMKNRAHGSR